MTLKEQIIQLAGRLSEEADSRELSDLLDDLQENGTDHEGGSFVDGLACAIVEAAIDAM